MCFKLDNISSYVVMGDRGYKVLLEHGRSAVSNAADINISNLVDVSLALCMKRTVIS